jgi:hypothetical protein
MEHTRCYLVVSVSEYFASSSRLLWRVSLSSDNPPHEVRLHFSGLRVNQELTRPVIRLPAFRTLDAFLFLALDDLPAELYFVLVSLRLCEDFSSDRT